MNQEISNDNPNYQDSLPIRKYSPAQELINNIPYLAMTVLGTVIFAVDLGGSTLGLTVAAAKSAPRKMRVPG